MDYPGVTEVIQVGLTEREQYIHRLGRTARAGREGAGLLILADFEAPALLPELHDLPISPSGANSDITGGLAAGMVGHPVTPSHAAPVLPGAPPRKAGGPRSPEAQAFLSRFRSVAPLAPYAPLAAAITAVQRNGELSKECIQAVSATYSHNLVLLLGHPPAQLARDCATFLTVPSS